MKAQILILVMMLSLLGCRSRAKTKTMSEMNTAVTTMADTLEVKKDSTVAVVKEKKQETARKKESNNDGEVLIKGKTDSANHFKYHSVVEGDTLAEITIQGNAVFEIRNRWKKAEQRSEVSSETNSLNAVATLARKAVNEKTIKAAAEMVRHEDKKVKEKGFTFGAWTSWIIAFAIVAVLTWLYFYLGGGLKRNRWNRN